VIKTQNPRGNYPDLQAIAHATRAYSWRVVDGQIELWRKKGAGWQVGNIVNEQVEWRDSPRTYPPEDTERL